MEKINLLISEKIDKEPYIKNITNDKIINITGESGSGKSYYIKKYLNDDNYIVIDTDIVFGDYPSENKESLEIRELFKGKSSEILISDFDNCYLKILNYFKGSNKILVIDSAQYRNIKDITILKGKAIVMRTSIDTCYKRVLNRYRCKNENYSEEEYNKYAKRKLSMYNWYKALNEFLIRLYDL